MFLCNLVAEYYVANHKWPLSKADLEDQKRKSLERERATLLPGEIQEAENFFGRFSLLKFQEHGGNLTLCYRFKIEKKVTDQAVTFKPGVTADDILHEATAEGYD